MPRAQRQCPVPSAQCQSPVLLLRLGSYQAVSAKLSAMRERSAPAASRRPSSRRALSPSRETPEMRPASRRSRPGPTKLA